MTTLILAAGQGSRWGNYLGVPKHMIPIKGEPLIHRTQRILAATGANDVYVVCRDSTYVLPPSQRATPQEVEREWVHEQEESRYLWSKSGRTILLYGDVYYSEDLLSRIVHEPADDWKVYARYGASAHTGKHHGEMFGWVFRPEHHRQLDAARNVAISYTENGLWWRCVGWELYRIAMGQVPWSHCRDEVHLVDYDDVSDDFDAPTDWDRWSSLHPELAF